MVVFLLTHFVAYNLYWKVMLAIIKSKFLEGDSHIKDGLSSSLKLVYGELALMKFCHVFKTDDEVFKHVYSLLKLRKTFYSCDF